MKNNDIVTQFQYNNINSPNYILTQKKWYDGMEKQ